MEAYNYFLRGRDDYEKFYYADARKFLEKAVSLDPTFAVAYLYLGKAAGAVFDTKAQIEAYEMAKRHSGKATEKERLYIEAGHAGVIEHDLRKRLRLLQELAAKYPQEKESHSDLGMLYKDLGQRQESLREYDRALALDPNFGFALNQAGYGYAEIGAWDKAISYIERYAAINPGQANPLDSLAELISAWAGSTWPRRNIRKPWRSGPIFSSPALAWLMFSPSRRITPRPAVGSTKRSPGPRDRSRREVLLG